GSLSSSTQPYHRSFFCIGGRHGAQIGHENVANAVLVKVHDLGVTRMGHLGEKLYFLEPQIGLQGKHHPKAHLAKKEVQPVVVKKVAKPEVGCPGKRWNPV